MTKVQRNPLNENIMAGDKLGDILIIEDNRDTQILLKYLLASEYNLVIIGDFNQAIEISSQSHFDLLLVDINLGEERTGVDLLNILRETEPYRNVPMIAITAYAMPGDYQRFLNIGFNAYISKPFTRMDLINTIKNFIPKSYEE